MSPFYLTKNEHGYYRVCFVNQQTGGKTIAKSTHCKNKSEAMIVAVDWYKNGVPKGTTNSRTPSLPSSNISSGLNLENLVSRLSEKEALELYSLLNSKLNLSANSTPVESMSSDTVTKTDVVDKAPPKTKKSKEMPRIKLCEYLLNFWDFEKSEFIARHLAHGKNMTKGHAKYMQSIIRNYWLPFFGEDMFIDELDKSMLDDFFFYLYDEKELQGATVNKAINSGSRAMKYLFDNHKISENPMTGVERFKSKQHDRGIPTETEVRKLLNLKWSNPFYKLAFKLGVFCGMRAGEVSGLQVCDLDLEEDVIYIRHSWSETDGLKEPKNSDERRVPIDHMTLLELYALARENPRFSDNSFVFFSPVKPEQPYGSRCYIDGLTEALHAIGISEEQRRDRNIVFHSLRHFCATILAQRTDMKTVQAILGHRTERMSEHYSDHDTQEKLLNMRIIMQDTWKEYLTA